MPDISVRYEEGDRFHATIRGHRLVIDQPVEDGGTDAGPTPTEFFVAGLASCVAFYAERFLRRHSLPVDGLAVDCIYAFGPDRPSRVGSIECVVHAPGLPASKRGAFFAVIDHCTVHNSMRQAPLVQIEVHSSERAA